MLGNPIILQYVELGEERDPAVVDFLFHLISSGDTSSRINLKRKKRSDMFQEGKS